MLEIKSNGCRLSMRFIQSAGIMSKIKHHANLAFRNVQKYLPQGMRSI